MKKYKIDINYIGSLVPTKIVRGLGCVRECPEVFEELGKHGLIITGGKSAFINGAVSDVINAFRINGQAVSLFDKVMPNPTISCVRAALEALKRANADFIVAIGGGSPMDVAKAVATLAVQDRADEDIFKGGYADKALPMAHIPTTAGTGSEVTPYAILTNDIEKTKTSISSNAMYPKVAILDAEYTKSLSRNLTINTAIDALSHAVEGMFTTRSSPTIDVAAARAIEVIYPRLVQLACGDELDIDGREDLLSASSLAGAVIAHTGTTIVHSMGYYLTYYHDIPHGRANGLLLGSMLKLCSKRGIGKVDKILSACKIRSVSEFSDLLNSLLSPIEYIKDEELFSYAREAAKSKKLPNIIYKPTYADILDMYLTSFSLGK